MAEFTQIKSILTSKIGSVAGKAQLSITVDGSTEVYILFLCIIIKTFPNITIKHTGLFHVKE